MQWHTSSSSLEVCQPLERSWLISDAVLHTITCLRSCSPADAGQGFTEQELDQKCEMYLDRHFRCKLDFALENTLPALMKDGLIRRDHQVG